jgi:hypothetical protein
VRTARPTDDVRHRQFQEFIVRWITTRHYPLDDRYWFRRRQQLRQPIVRRWRDQGRKIGTCQYLEELAFRAGLLRQHYRGGGCYMMAEKIMVEHR